MNVNLSSPGACHVLVVEDDWALRSILSRILRRAGYTVEAVSCGEEALAAVGTEEKAGPSRFALVMSDVQMPRIDGIELASLLAERGLAVPVILLTALDPDLVYSAVGELGMVRAVLPKPFDPAMLLAAVRNHAVCG
jgi:two-component system response regulator FlrC